MSAVNFIFSIQTPDLVPMFLDVQFIAETNNGRRQGPTYRYFGAAKDLPGVKELLEKQQEKIRSMHRKKRGPNEIYRHVNQAYFGWKDEEDGVLLELEEDAFQKHKQELLLNNAGVVSEDESNSKRQRTAGKTSNNLSDDDVNVVDLDNLLSKDYLAGVPTQEEMKQSMFAEKKKALLELLGCKGK